MTKGTRKARGQEINQTRTERTKKKDKDDENKEAEREKLKATSSMSLSHLISPDGFNQYLSIPLLEFEGKLSEKVTPEKNGICAKVTISLGSNETHHVRGPRTKSSMGFHAKRREINVMAFTDRVIRRKFLVFTTNHGDASLRCRS